MHDESITTRLRRRSELELEGLDVEGRLAGLFVENGFLEGAERRRWDGDSGLLRFREEEVPSRGVVAGEIRCECERRDDVAVYFCRVDFLHAARFPAGRGLATEHGVHVGFVGVNVFKVCGVDGGNVGRARGDDAAFDDELDEGGDDDVFFAAAFEEGFLYDDVGELAGDGHGGVVLFGGESARSVGGELAPDVFWERHVLLDGYVGFGVAFY